MTTEQPVFDPPTVAVALSDQDIEWITCAMHNQFDVERIVRERAWETNPSIANLVMLIDKLYRAREALLPVEENTDVEE